MTRFINVTLEDDFFDTCHCDSLPYSSAIYIQYSTDHILYFILTFYHLTRMILVQSHYKVVDLNDPTSFESHITSQSHIITVLFEQFMLRMDTV
jgi:hypothetical protein